MTSDADVLSFVARFTAEHGYSPTVREVGAGCGIPSTHTVLQRMRSLREAGLVTFVDGCTHTVRDVETANTCLPEVTEPLKMGGRPRRCANSPGHGRPPTTRSRQVTTVPLPRHGIETAYKGTLFRSRLEARWAAFFDRVGWSWEYEPFDADGYIPDFLLLGADPVLVEVKPAATLSDLIDPMRHTLERAGDLWPHDVLCLGVSPFMPSSWDDTPCLGLVSRWQEKGSVQGPGGDPVLSRHYFDCALPGFFGPMEALWCACASCGRQTFTPSAIGCARSLAPAVCCRDSTATLPITRSTRPEWADATNAVRWTA